MGKRNGLQFVARITASVDDLQVIQVVACITENSALVMERVREGDE